MYEPRKSAGFQRQTPTMEKRPRGEGVAGVKRWNPRHDALEIIGGDHDGRLGVGGQRVEVDALVDVRRVGRADEERVGSVDRPALDVGGAEIRGVNLGAGDLGDAVDARQRCSDRRHGRARLFHPAI